MSRAIPKRPWCKHLHRSAALKANPFAHSRLVAESPGTDPASRLRGVLSTIIDALRENHGAAQYQRLLTLTFLQGPLTREAAAARHNLSYSTYRRRLPQALALVREELWARELHGINSS
ncbi:hypothetical protein AB0L49_42255 [Streptomyces antimycoticus]|uniref:hypothetical protein n=1 Tax=Streptomyces antimycoticus TaxID=68175 RepID=UPI00343261F4